MASRGKMAAVAALLLVGAAAVVVFRKQPTPTGPADAADSTLVLREEASVGAGAAVAAPRLLGTIEPLESADVAPSGAGIGVATLPAAPVPAPNRNGTSSRDGEPAGDPYGSQRARHQVRDIPPRRESSAARPVDGQTHRIVDGDTLSGLATQYLGSSGRYLEIYDLNRGVLPDPDLLPIGVEIRIPAPGVQPPASHGVSAKPLAPVPPREG